MDVEYKSWTNAWTTKDEVVAGTSEDVDIAGPSSHAYKDKMSGVALHPLESSTQDTNEDLHLMPKSMCNTNEESDEGTVEPDPHTGSREMQAVPTERFC